MPDESFAGFKVFETVSPFRPGSVSETVLVTNVGSSTFKTSPSQKIILHSSSPSNQSLIFSHTLLQKLEEATLYHSHL